MEGWGLSGLHESSFNTRRKTIDEVFEFFKKKRYHDKKKELKILKQLGS